MGALCPIVVAIMYSAFARLVASLLQFTWSICVASLEGRLCTTSHPYTLPLPGSAVLYGSTRPVSPMDLASPTMPTDKKSKSFFTRGWELYHRGRTYAQVLEYADNMKRVSHVQRLWLIDGWEAGEDFALNPNRKDALEDDCSGL